MTETLITAEVDFERAGKQTGFLRLPHSTHRSAYGWIPVPIVVFRHGEGPTVLLMAGNHGDEYEGQIALSRFVAETEAEDFRGRVIILTMANFPAAAAGLRTSPIDGGNLNRAFPGARRGAPTEMIAHYIEAVLTPLADVVVDLHSGGTSLVYPSTLLRGAGQDAAKAARLATLQEAFDLPYAWVFASGGGRQSSAPTAMGAANRKGVVSVMAELGGGGQVCREALSLAERGIRRVLHALGMLPSYRPDAPRGTRELTVQGSVYAYETGVFEPFKDIADPVSKGELVGLVHHPETPWRSPDPVRSPFDGLALCRRALGRVERGDAVFQIAADRHEGGSA